VSQIDPKDRRKARRIEVFAQASVSAGHDVHVMAVRNISAGGIYLEGSPPDYPDLRTGAPLDLMIFGSEEGLGHEEQLNIHCKGQVVRVDPGFGDQRPPGFGVMIEPAGHSERAKLTRLMLRASGYSAKRDG
jgi:hypothetical protein